MTKAAKFNLKLKQNRPFDWVNIVLMCVFAFITIYPLWYVIVGAFNEGQDYSLGGVYFWPRKWDINNFVYVLTDKRIWQGYLVTIGRTLLGTVLHIAVTFTVANAMSRSNLKFRKAYHIFMLFTMFFGGGIIPYYILLKYLGLLNNFLVYILPGMFSVYNMLVFVAFIKGLPDALRESAVIDGAGEYRICYQIIFPLCKPVLATVALWQIVGHWNNYFDSMFYVTDSSLYTLQYVLKQIIREVSVAGNDYMSPDLVEKLSSQTVSFAAIIVCVLPVLAVYPFLQKHFTKGYMIGSLKG